MSFWYLLYLLLPVTLYFLRDSISIIISDFRNPWTRPYVDIDLLMFYMFLVGNLGIIFLPLFVTGVV